MRSVFTPLAAAIALACSSTLAFSDALSDVYELALRNDARLKAAQASYRANIETENLAFSQMLPQVAATAGYEEGDITSKSRSHPAFPEQDNDVDSEQETYGVNLQQKVFDLPTWFSFKSGKALTKQAEAQLAADQQDLIIRVAEAYFAVLRAQDNLEASRAEERATKRQLEQTQQRFDVGLIAITDVHEARAVYDNTVVERLTFEGNLGTSYEALTVITGHYHADLWSLNEKFPIIDPVPSAREQWVEFSLVNNKQLLAASSATEASRQSATSKKMEHMPKVTASYGWNKSLQDTENADNIGGSDFDGYNDTDGTSWGVQLTVPIFAGGGISASRRQAYEQYNAVFQTEIDARRSVIQATRSLHLTVTTDVQRVAARERTIISTRSALEATEAGYEVGTRNIVDVLQAQRALYGSIRDYANSRYDYVLNMLRLKQQAGTLSPADVQDLNTWLQLEQVSATEQFDS